MNISLRQMQAFVAVAQYASFTRAAQRLHITQSGLSALTRVLEEQFGARLFDRTTRAVSLTPAGRELLPAVERVLAEIDGVQVRVARADHDSASRLTLAASPMVASSLMPSVLAAFDDARTGVTVTVRDAIGPNIQALVAQGDADVGFSVLPTAIAGVVRQPLMRFHLMAVFKPGTLEPRQVRGRALPQLRWGRLRDVPLITSTVIDITQQLTASHIAAVGDMHRGSRSYDSLHTMVAMAAAGYGVAIVPSFALPACLRYGAECARLVEPTASVGWSHVMRKGSTAHPAFVTFRKTLLKVAREVCGE
jgi:DNA-binding transcriptional LysR family regulator